MTQHKANQIPGKAQSTRVKQSIPHTDQRNDLQRASDVSTPFSQTDADALQRTIGNQAVGQLLIQPKLALGPVGDKYEQAADAVAKQVVNHISTSNKPATQRREEEELQKMPVTAVQRQEDEELQMKPDALNQSLQARAFTTGQDIFFRQGEYNLDSSGGQELITHELAHVVQQNGNTVNRQEEEDELQMKPFLQRQVEKQTSAAPKTEPIIPFTPPILTTSNTISHIQRLNFGIKERFRQWQLTKMEEQFGRKEGRKQKEGVDTPDFDTLKTATGLTNDITGITGLFGTAGASNTGTSDVGKEDTLLGDALIKKFDKPTNDTLSGQSDMAGAGAGLIGNVAGITEALTILENPNASKHQKQQARLKLGAAYIGSGENLLKGTGGYLTTKGGGGKSSWDHTNDAGETDVSAATDVKAAGDWAGVLSGGLGIGAQTYAGGRDFFKWRKDIASGKFAAKKDGGKGFHAYLRSLGRGLKSGTGLAKSSAQFSGGVAKLVGQIQGGGQVASDFAETGTGVAAAGATTAAGALGVATGSMEAISGGFKWWKANKRKEKIANEKKPEPVDKKEFKAAMAHLEEIQGKKITRGKKGIASGALGIAAGALTLSGVGAIGGLALGAGLGAAKLGHWGFKKVRQMRRDREDAKQKEIRKQMKKDNFSDLQIDRHFAKQKEELDDEANSTGFKGFKARAKRRFQADASKSTANKEDRYKRTATTLLTMEEETEGTIRSLIGVTPNQIRDIDENNKIVNTKKKDAKIKLIMDAMKKR